MKKRTQSFFDAYYTSDVKTVQNFCEQFGVFYIVVEKRHFTSDYLSKKRMYYEPFNTYIKTITKDKKNFILVNEEREKEFVKGDISVIKC
jgi:hypothetical protein